jgi:protein SCO1/2
VPYDAVLHDEAGHAVDLRALTGGRPAILALGYFHCPSLCGIVRDDLLSAVSRSGLHAPGDYALIALSIDPAETSQDAADAKRQELARYPVPGAAQAWHYLTGPAASVQAIEQAVGFRAKFDDQLNQFLHPTGIVFLTPKGIVSGYLLGVGYQPGDISLGVTRARDGGIAKAALPVLLLCFHFDPSTGRYTLAITKLLQLAGAITVLTLGGTLALALRRDRRR